MNKRLDEVTKAEIDDGRVILESPVGVGWVSRISKNWTVYCPNLSDWHGRLFLCHPDTLVKIIGS